MIAQDNEERWRTGGEGRLDVNGFRWWACDPYPTWYRWDLGHLFTNPGPWAEPDPKRKWDGWHCTECGRYHGYGRIFTYEYDVLCEICNGHFRHWLIALGREDEWRSPL